MGGATLPVDASLARKRQRAGDSNTNDDADNDRASKRSRKDDNASSKKSDKGGKKNKNSTPDEPRRSGRDRNSGDSSNWWQATGSNANEAETVESPAAAKAKSKPAKTTKADQPKKSKAGRPSKSTEAAEEAIEATPTSKIKSKKTKNKAQEPEEAAEADTTRTKPKRGRPRTSNAIAEAAGSPTTDSPAAKKQKKSKSKSSTAKSPRASKKTTEAETLTTSPKRRKKAATQPEVEEEQEDNEEVEEEVVEEEEAEEEEEADELQQPFRQLVPHTRLVPLATMTKKWVPLDRDAIAAVQSLLDECARPVLARLGSSTDRKERQDIARQAVASVTRRLRSKLVKGIPFPSDHPRSKKTDKKGKPAPTQVSFLGEPTAETHALQSQLTPLQHAVALLESERRREEAALADEYAQLRALETNSQAEQRTWRERQRRQHVLADSHSQTQIQSDMDKQGSRVGRDSQGLAPSRGDNNDNGKEKAGLFSDGFDSSVVDLAALGSHMDSVRGNLQQIDGVVAAMARSRAALQDVLGERLSGEQYERVLLGR